MGFNDIDSTMVETCNMFAFLEFVLDPKINKE